MIDHITLRVSDFHASKAFYETVLAPLGYAEPWSDEEQRAADWGDLSISQDDQPLTENVHVAFAARSRAGSRNSTGSRWPPGIATTGLLASGSTTRVTTRRSCSIRTATTWRRCFTIVELEPDAYEEIVRRLVSLRDLAAELAAAYEDRVMWKGAEEMRESLERVLELLGHK